MRRFAIATAILLSLVVAQSHAGVAEPTAPSPSPDLKLSKGSLLGNSASIGFKGLLDPNRLTFQNTYGLEDKGAFREDVTGMPEDYENPDTEKMESYAWVHLESD